MTKTRERAAVVLVLALMTTFLAEGIAPVPVAAEVAPMQNLSPDGTSAATNPVFTWDPVPGYTGSYSIQISQNGAFSSNIYNIPTYNTSFTPPAALPVGTIHWRVRAQDGGGNSFQTAQFDKTAAEGPTLTGPADGAVMQFPVQPPVFSWDPVPDARSYVFELSTSNTFVSPASFVVQTTAATLIDIQGKGQTFYWRVRGASNANGTGVLSDWSAIRGYSVGWDTVGKPELISPPSSTSSDDAITDIELRWTPVLGASRYFLQVSLNQDFSGSSVFAGTLVGATWQPDDTIDNGQYFWRVRAQDLSDAPGPWSDTFAFVRDWSDTVSLSSPVDNEQYNQPERFSWDPVQRASHYEIQVASDQLFTEVVSSCFTNQTTLSPSTRIQGEATQPGESCPVFANDFGDARYWRVRGLDAPTGVVSPWSMTRSVVRDLPPEKRIVLLTPAEGAMTSAPALSWTPVEGADAYEVNVLKNDGGEQATAVTHATTFTPFAEAINPADGPFSWFIVPLFPEGRRAPNPNEADWRTFDVVSPPETFATPELLEPPSGAASVSMPAMRWDPVAGADAYEVHYLNTGTADEHVDAGPIRSSSYTRPQRLPAGTYEWWVVARDVHGEVISQSSSERSFVLQSLPPTEAYVAPAFCPPGNGCDALTTTPTFEWEPVESTAYYVVYVALDENFTNLYAQYTTNQHFFTPRESYADNDVGQAYFWHVQQCDTSEQVCSPSPVDQVNPTHSAFQKRSDAVVLSSPADGAEVSDQPTFTWEPYLGSASSSFDARNYQIQISTEPSFSPPLDSAEVDQPFYTPRATTYPEGPLYWRVRARDNSDNLLIWSPTRTFEKRSPTLTQVTPSAGQVIDGAPNFSWEAQAWAPQYDLQVNTRVDGALGPMVINLEALNAPSWVPRDALGSGDYTWRVRRRDASNHFGPWTEYRDFTIAGIAPLLLSPPEGIKFESDETLFTWDAVPGAGSYLWERSSSPDFTSIAEQRSTIMSAWAPVVRIDNGEWWWRVTAIAPNGQSMGTSAARKFSRDTRDLPTSPRNLSVSATAGTLNVAWQTPSALGDPQLNGYRVTVSPGGIVRNVGAGTLSTTFTGMTNGVSYSISVLAVSPDGESAEATANAAPPGCVNTPFTDVASSNPFCTEIAWLFGTEITTGSVMPDGSVEYRPAAPVTRMAMAAFLHRFAGDQPSTLTSQYFADVPPSHPFYDDIQWMAETNLSTGTPQDGGQLPLYKPNNPVSRQAMAAFMHRSDGNSPVTLPEPFFADVPESHPFYVNIQWMAQTGLSTGTEQGSGQKPLYKPVDAVSRQAMAAFLFRFNEYLAA